ncbi:MAG: hypothetical protein CEE43_01620 [Promethearchaeota archaeon Loki_b32]|nr:MAG: hypothetical protein CEE43_01620 [Candidatus Lokiarchaeota archaeon Loki_b32]
MNKNHQLNESFDISSQAVDRSGKIFDNITRFSKNCFINREQPSLNEQPSVNIPNYNISYAEMSFENITAVNYTRSIESDFSEFIFSSQNGPTCVYQKFAVEMNQYVNNVSILIQDINNPSSFTDENSWEVSIVNCLSDSVGTPNSFSNGTLGSLQKPHPITYAAHWEVFDFKNDGTGPIFLNTSNTKMTNDGRYWFAFRIKIPQDDSYFDGGPKFLYFNPDDDDIGEGDIYAISPDFSYDAYTINDVNVSEVTSGIYIKGDLDSFKYSDEDRYLTTDSNNVTIDLKVHLDNLKNSPFNYTELLILHKLLNWPFDHYKYIFSFDFYLIVNVSDISRIKNATLSIYNYKSLGWVTLPYDIIQENETMIYISIRNPWEKIEILRYMDNLASINNTLRFQLEYIGNGLGDFNISINHFKVEVGEIENLRTIQRHDPLVQELAFPSNIGIVNGSTASFGDQTLDSLEANDDDYYQAQALTNNLTFFMTFNVLNNMDSSLWDVDYYDWLVSYPNPAIPLMDIRISSNVSKPENLEYAILALHKGNATFDILEPDANKAEWIILSRPREFALMNETTTILHYDAGFTWIFLNLLNESRNNEINLVLFYYTNESSDHGFIVSINEFSLNFYIQNAIPSDISSSIGLGINSNALTPSDIRLQNFGIDIGDTGIGSGFWEGDIDNAVFPQGIFEFNITSLWHSIRFDVNGTYEIFKIEPILEFVETPASQYMTGTTFISVLITGYGGKPLENFEIIFEVLNSNGITIYEASSISNEEGIATVTIQFESTGERYSIQAEFAESGFYASVAIVSGYIRVVNEFILFMDEFLNVLPYIIIGALAIASYVTVRKVKHGKQRKFWASEAKILDDLVKIAHFMIIHKDVGVSIYNKQISLEGIDSDLISGFLQAISHFRSEIKKDSTAAEGKGFEMDYGDFKIVITDGNYVRVALILDGTPSEKLKENQWLFTEDFERRYGKLLKDFIGDITPFREADDLIEKRFNISLIYPLQLGKHYGVIKLKGLEKALIEVGEQIQKERKFFFISSLLNFALAGRKASRDEIISAIIDLKRKGLIIPAKVE